MTQRLRQCSHSGKGSGVGPTLKGLHEAVAAEVLLTTGILTRWLGNRSEIKEADDYARDLITESITLYEALKTQERLQRREQNLVFATGA